MTSHESFDRSHEVKTATERSFGLVFAGVFCVVAGWRAWGAHTDYPGWLAAAAVLALLALFWTRPLVPLNRLWMRLGALLHAIVTPVLMGLMFALLIVPTGLILRLLGKDLLRLRRDPSAPTYWVDCPDPAARPQAMKDQF